MPTDPSTIEVRPGGLIQPGLLGAADDGFILPGVTNMGCGIDVVTKPYATVESLLEPLFDITERFDSNSTSDPQRARAYAEVERLYGRDTYGFAEVLPRISNTADYHFWSGHTLTEMQKSVMAQASVEGSYNGFQGQIQGMVSDTRRQSASAYCCNIHGVFRKYILHLAPRKPLKELLKPEVREALETWSADQLKSSFFPRFGGYFLKYGLVGGILHYRLIRTKTSTENDQAFQASVQASYGYCSGNASASGEEAHKRLDDSTVGSIHAQGGNGTILAGDKKSLRKWTESIVESPELIDFDRVSGESGCAPVWSLVDDAARQDVIRETFLEYAYDLQTLYEEFHDPDLVPLFGYADRHSYSEMPRWYYSLNAKPETGWQKKKTLYVYASPRPGCAKFTCVKQEKKRRFAKKILVHKIVEGSAPGGWKAYATFYAPKQALKGTLDKWAKITEYERNENGEYCGLHYTNQLSKGSAWHATKGGVTFHAVLK